MFPSKYLLTLLFVVIASNTLKYSSAAVLLTKYTTEDMTEEMTEDTTEDTTDPASTANRPRRDEAALRWITIPGLYRPLPRPSPGTPAPSGGIIKTTIPAVTDDESKTTGSPLGEITTYVSEIEESSTISNAITESGSTPTATEIGGPIGASETTTDENISTTDSTLIVDSTSEEFDSTTEDMAPTTDAL